MYYGSAIYLIYYFSRRFFRKRSQTELSEEQFLLQKYVKERISREDAAQLWKRIDDHKWFISERIGRDVGLNVAAVDYLENIYPKTENSVKSGNFQTSFLESSFS